MLRLPGGMMIEKVASKAVTIVEKASLLVRTLGSLFKMQHPARKLDVISCPQAET